MYETEANTEVESGDQIPAHVVNELGHFRSNVVARTLLPWSEHCTECVWPSCYTTCDLYSPRSDGRCRRFIDGMVRVECPGSVNSYLLKIRFKRWGKLWTPGNTNLSSLEHADHLEQRDRSFAVLLHQLPAPRVMRAFITEKRYGWKKRIARNAPPVLDLPDSFVLECYNPGDQVISLSLTMRPLNDPHKPPYQRLVQAAPGFSREAVPTAEISGVLDLRAPFDVEVIPNEVPDGTTLFFGLLDFVKTRTPLSVTMPDVKCIVWDLDNTMWDGTLVEDGAEKLTLMPGIVDVLAELDRRGILHSIASKNSFDAAMAVLRSKGISDYFVHPQISWAPKSGALKAIAKKLNIGTDTLMFVDDSDFELAQVQSACEGVRVLRAERYRELLGLAVRGSAVTAESSGRRKMYQEDANRASEAANFGGDYLAFLTKCNIRMEIEPLSAHNVERVHELTQRTNQMNFSGKRYERKVLEEIGATSYLDTYVITCRDRFGSYGVVGFAIVDSREPRLTDLMFSCRIQGKRVDHAFLTYLLRKYLRLEVSSFHADLRKTTRNALAGRIFEEIGMDVEGESEGVTSLVFHKDHRVPDDGIVTLKERDSSGTLA